MALTIEEAIEWIHSRLKFGSRPGLDRVQALLALLEHPETKVTTIHIAGTNGKGSTVSYLQAMIQETGQTVGTFTSPFIESFNERIAINGQPITDGALIALVERVQPFVFQMDQEEKLAGITEFELLTAMGLLHFFEESVDVAIIEVGLGGLLDSTNVISPILTAITTIGMDHTDILGETIEEIATQKAGIIKQGIPIVTGNVSKDALVVINQVAEKQQAPIQHFNQEYHVTYRHPDQSWGEVFDFTNESGKISTLLTPLLGKHQVENAGVAIQLFLSLLSVDWTTFPRKNVRDGLKKTYWPARMERISQEPLIILDGAHNEHAMKRLTENLKQEFKEYHIYVLFSALETKDIQTMLSQLLNVPNAEIYLTSFDYPKALELSNHYEQLDTERITVASLWQFGLAELLEKVDSEDLILVTGSLYFISEVRKLLMSEN